MVMQVDRLAGRAVKMPGTNNKIENITMTVENKNEVAAMPRINALTALTQQFGLVDENEVYGILMKTVMPSGSSNEEVAAFCMTAAAYGLNPFIKEIHAFRGKNGGIQPMVGIDGWLKLVHGNEDFDGMEHRYADDGSWVECIIYSKSKSRPTVAREFLVENKVESSPVWKQRPMRMLRHRATIQAIRYFMGLGGLADRDEYIEYETQTAPMRDANTRVTKPAFLPQAEAQQEAEAPKKSEPKEAEPMPIMLPGQLPMFGELV